MRKAILVAFLSCRFACLSEAQQLNDSLSLNLDSIERELDLFLSSLGYGMNKSYLQLTTGFHNSSLSINNRGLNAQQSVTQPVFSTGVNYRHQTGLMVGVEPRFVISGSNTGFLQSAFSTGYSYNRNPVFQAGITYTHYVVNPQLRNSATPYSNEWYLFGQVDKWKLSPFLSLGYASGQYLESTIQDSSFLLNRPFPRPDTIIRFQIFDTLRVRLRDFSFSTGLSFRYIREGRKPQRFFTLTPSLLFFFAQNKYDVEYTSVSVFSPRLNLFLQQRPLLREELVSQLRRQFPGLNQTRSFLNTTRFGLQSIGLNLDAAFYRKKFFINPQLYLDYYLLGNRNQLNAFYSIETGWIF